jgi:hypothetical protein
MSLELLEVQCPYCGETNEVEVEIGGKGMESFIQDCTVCCRPIQFTLSPGIDGPELTASRSD